jgi:hypothetical protein
MESAAMSDLSKTTAAADDGFWMQMVSRIGSNSATDGFANLGDLINSGRLTESELRGLSAALRSLHQTANDRCNELREAARLRRVA